MEYVITGGAGFIGSNIAKLLLKEDHTVTILDNLNTGKMENIESIKNKINFKLANHIGKKRRQIITL